MDYGAKYIRWAPFAKENPELDGKLPSYDHNYLLTASVRGCRMPPTMVPEFAHNIFRKPSATV